MVLRGRNLKASSPNKRDFVQSVKVNWQFVSITNTELDKPEVYYAIIVIVA